VTNVTSFENDLDFGLAAHSEHNKPFSFRSKRTTDFLPIPPKDDIVNCARQFLPSRARRAFIENLPPEKSWK
jgi:hypothetical protein